MMLRSIDAVLTQQALIVGSVEDALTSRPTFNPPSVELRYQTPAGAPVRRYPLTARVYENGQFVFAGDPLTAFPKLSGSETLDLRLTVSAERYQTQSFDFSLAAADLTPTEEVRQFDGRNVTVALLVAPLVEQPIALSPQPVHLSGRVVDADDRDQPIPNARVRLMQPATPGPVEADTDDDGFFVLHDLPVVSVITVRVSKPPRFEQLVQEVTLDYRQPINQQTLALTPKNPN